MNTHFKASEIREILKAHAKKIGDKDTKALVELMPDHSLLKLVRMCLDAK